jgi:hypothetical protein
MKPDLSNLNYQNWTIIPEPSFLNNYSNTIVPKLLFLNYHSWTIVPELSILNYYSWSVIPEISFLNYYFWAIFLNYQTVRGLDSWLWMEAALPCDLAPTPAPLFVPWWHDSMLRGSFDGHFALSSSVLTFSFTVPLSPSSLHRNNKPFQKFLSGIPTEASTLRSLDFSPLTG